MTITLTDDSGGHLTIRNVTNQQLNALLSALKGAAVRIYVGDTEPLNLDALTRWPHPRQRRTLTTPW